MFPFSPSPLGWKSYDPSPKVTSWIRHCSVLSVDIYGDIYSTSNNERSSIPDTEDLTEKSSHQTNVGHFFFNRPVFRVLLFKTRPSYLLNSPQLRSAGSGIYPGMMIQSHMTVATNESKSHDCRNQ